MEHNRLTGDSSHADSYEYRRGASRRLPNVLVIGAAKAGTTTVYQYLKQHP